MKNKKKMGIFGFIGEFSSNHYNIGRILKSDFELDLIGYYGKDRRINSLFSIKTYTRQPANEPSLLITAIINLYRYCRYEKPHILCSLQRPDLIGPLVAVFGKLFGIKTVVRFSGSTFDNYKQKTGLDKIITYFACKWFMRINFLADKIICMGEEQKQELIRHGCNPKKIYIILQPTDTEIFKPASKSKARDLLKLDKTAEYFLYVGALEKYKGIDTFINIIPAVSRDKNIKFIFIGKDRGNYKSKLKKAGKSNVIFINHIPQKELVKYYQASDLLIHPSYIEGFPKTVLEAAACRLPVAARDIVGIGRIANKTFKTDSELLKYILGRKWRKETGKIPESFSWKSLEKKYLTLFNKTYNTIQK